MIKKALITGGTRGIGYAIAEILIKKGYLVTVTGTQKNGRGPAQSLYLPCDFNNEKSLADFLLTITNENWDVLVNNAGINKIGPMDEYDFNDFQKIQFVNVHVPFLITKAVLPSMKKRKYGRILNITSIFGVVSRAERSAYSTSKFGLQGMTKALALEVAKDGILVNCLAPGFVDTTLTRKILKNKGIKEISKSIPMGRLAKADEIGKAAGFLLSEENSYMTGQNIIIDGGFTCA
ncbi:MAG: SDR family NAD(P)-dependent oxidoreductase [Elusimicrobiota bacterium]